MNERDLLRAYPAYAPYRELLREIFEEPPEAFVVRFPQLAASWEPFLRHLFDRDFDIDSLRKAASDIGDFQTWLLDRNEVLNDIPPSLIDEFIRDLRHRFHQRNQHPMDPRAVSDVHGAIESFLVFAAHQQGLLSKKPGAGS